MLSSRGRRGDHNILKRGTLSFLALLVTLTGLEAGARVWSAHVRARAERHAEAPVFIRTDPILGWRAAPNRNVALDATGHRFTTDHRGWRRYDVPDPRPLLLVLGDSYTHAVGVADGAVYYDVLARQLDVAIAALAVNGYGTVQEWLIAREAAGDLRRPAAVLLQMTDNDVINNSLLLERRSFHNNNLMLRPYLEAVGRVRLGDPRRLHERFVLGRELTRHWLAGRWPTIETAIEAGAPGPLALYRQELGHTAQALRLLRQVFADSPAFVFNVGGSESRVARDVARLAIDAGFRHVDIGGALREEARTRGIVQADGAHWNEAGHDIAGRLLMEALAPQLTSVGRPR